MPKKDTTRWIDLPYLSERDAIDLIRRSTDSSEAAVAANYTRQVLFYVPGAAVTGTSVSGEPVWRGEDGIPQRIDARAKGTPTGAALQYTVKAGGTTVGTVTIADGATAGTTSTMSVNSIDPNTAITLDCDQVGSTTSGSDVTVTLECLVATES